jgi:hypothetical protein
MPLSLDDVKRVLIAIAALLSPAAVAFTLSNFNTHVRVAAPASPSLARVALPAEALRASLHGNGDDIGVFNEKGEPMPFAVIAAQPLATNAAPSQVALIPVIVQRADQVKRKASDEVISETALDGVVIERVRGQGALRVSVSGKAAQAANPPSGNLRTWTYSVLGEPEIMDFLVFDVPETISDFAMPVRVETSVDLSAWTLAAEGTIYRLNAGNAVRESLRLVGNQQRARFVRVTAATGSAIERDALRGLLVEHPASAGVRVPSETLTVALTAGGAPNEWIADLGGRFSLTGLRAQLPQTNTVANVQWSARANAKDAWTPIGTDTVYRLQNRDADLQSPEMPLRNVAARAVRAVVDARSGNVANGATLSVRYQPLEVLFAAKGAGPFTVGVGLTAASVSPVSTPVATLVPSWSDNVRARVPVVAVESVAANAAPTPIKPGIPWRTVAWWALLPVGASVAAALAYRRFKPKAVKERVARG